ncbi:hypothetical protein Dsin_013983 [Dipteronia sinensis]|uniref:Uncharacterized protein n=1 Tax=Dipteronia sinensis TaxID=43782 RepID=A0AAE0E9E1_9ROSI|nr:hypothetical protein Dsin_013983 [Dipteronia sinensis]
MCFMSKWLWRFVEYTRSRQVGEETEMLEDFSWTVVLFEKLANEFLFKLAFLVCELREKKNVMWMILANRKALRISLVDQNVWYYLKESIFNEDMLHYTGMYVQNKDGRRITTMTGLMISPYFCCPSCLMIPPCAAIEEALPDPRCCLNLSCGLMSSHGTDVDFPQVMDLWYNRVGVGKFPQGSNSGSFIKQAESDLIHKIPLESRNSSKGSKVQCLDALRRKGNGAACVCSFVVCTVTDVDQNIVVQNYSPRWTHFRRAGPYQRVYVGGDGILAAEIFKVIDKSFGFGTVVEETHELLTQHTMKQKALIIVLVWSS